MDSTPFPPLTGGGRRGPKDETPESGKPIKCDLCNVWCQGVVSYQSHLQGRQHFANLKKPEGVGEANGQTPKKAKKRPSGTVLEEVRCEVCDLTCLGKEQLEVHLQGIKHAKRAKMTEKEEIDISTLPFIKELGGKAYQCTICNVEVTGKLVVISHISGAKHQRKADPNTPKIEITGKNNKTTTPTGEPLECKVCKLPVNSLFQLEEHKRSLKHKHKEEAYNKWCIKEANIGKDYDAWDPTG
uniref:C2H2-type domain-containing protein n=1 Tax=Lygus hesperus TaxID=30085 RepID=A0A0K8T0Q1_LYGHE